MSNSAIYIFYWETQNCWKVKIFVTWETVKLPMFFNHNAMYTNFHLKKNYFKTISCDFNHKLPQYLLKFLKTRFLSDMKLLMFQKANVKTLTITLKHRKHIHRKRNCIFLLIVHYLVPFKDKLSISSKYLHKYTKREVKKNSKETFKLTYEK